MKPTRSAIVSTVAVVGSAATGLATKNVALAVLIMVVAAAANFYWVWRTQQKALLPREALNGVISDVLSSVGSQFNDRSLQAGLCLWRPRDDGKLGVCCVTSDLAARLPMQAVHEPDVSSAVWNAHVQRTVQFQLAQQAAAVTAGTAPAVVAAQHWWWRLAHPVLDVSDPIKSVGVLAVVGSSQIVALADLDSFQVVPSLEHAVVCVRRAVSLLGAYD